MLGCSTRPRLVQQSVTEKIVGLQQWPAAPRRIGPNIGGVKTWVAAPDHGSTKLVYQPVVLTKSVKDSVGHQYPIMVTSKMLGTSTRP